ncbi:MAG: hypothetical protein MUF49_00055 [Oculatellaceae cyanobacterium Prado106]|nr:hypothetical protein [Oculatellaceae cyanobacterium Prado106]
MSAKFIERYPLNPAEYLEIEGLPQEPNRFWQRFHDGLQSLFSTLVTNSEPKIRLKQNRNGERYWQVYDPSTNYSTTFDSETAVRIWLEQRYYTL